MNSLSHNKWNVIGFALLMYLSTAKIFSSIYGLVTIPFSGKLTNGFYYSSLLFYILLLVATIFVGIKRGMWIWYLGVVALIFMVPLNLFQEWLLLAGMEAQNHVFSFENILWYFLPSTISIIILAIKSLR